MPVLSGARTTRARLLSAAVSAFAAKGFHATTTRDIAAAAGISPAAMYVHHKSKEELLYLIALTGNQRVLSRLREVIAACAEPLDQVRHVVREFAYTHARDHEVARVINDELNALSAEHHAQIRALRREIVGEVRAMLDRGTAAGVIDPPDTGLAATALLSVGVDIARWYRPEGRWTPDYIADQYATMALRMLGARP